MRARLIWLAAGVLILLLGACAPDTPVSSSDPDQPAGSDAGVSRTGAVAGQVLTAGGQPIVQAVVVPVSADNGGQPVPELAALTDEQGAYAWQLPPGRYEMQATADDYRPQTLAVEVRLGETTALDFALEQP